MCQNAGLSEPTNGEGRGVRSVIAARYGLGKADPEAGESEEVRLEVDMLDLNDDPMAGNEVGDVKLWCSEGSEEMDVS